MSIFLSIVGWIVFVIVSALSFFVGQVTAMKKDEDVSNFGFILLFLAPVFAIVSKILWIENIWLATGIWLVGGFVLGYISGRLPSSKERKKPSNVTTSASFATRKSIDKMPTPKIEVICDTCGSRLKPLSMNVTGGGGFSNLLQGSVCPSCGQVECLDCNKTRANKSNPPCRQCGSKVIPATG